MPRHLLATAPQARTMAEELADLVSRAEATAALLADESGSLLARHGRLPGDDHAETAGLLACNFLITYELAKHLGESEVEVLVHEGERRNFYVRRCGLRALLAVLFDDPGALGRVRAFADRSAAALAPLVGEMECEALPASTLDPSFPDAARERLAQALAAPAAG